MLQVRKIHQCGTDKKSLGIVLASEIVKELKLQAGQYLFQEVHGSTILLRLLDMKDKGSPEP
jgi:hypothetical protein